MHKIMLVSYMNADAPTGVRVYYERLDTELRAMGNTTCIVTENMSAWYWRKATGLLRRIFSVAAGWDRRLLSMEVRCFARIYQACRMSSFEPDIIHAQDPGSAVAAGMAFHWRIPVIVTCHFNEHPVIESAFRCGLSPADLPLLARWYNGLFRKLRRFICVSEYAKRKLDNVINADSRVAVIPNGVDFENLKQVRPAFDLRERFGNKLAILNVGHLEKRKNQRKILDIAALLENPEMVFWLVGEGEDRCLLESEIISRKLQEKVFLLGNRADVPSVMHAAFLYLHTALNDNCPLAILEAIACGLPTFALATGGTPELLRTTQSLALFDKITKPHDIVRRIHRYSNNPAEASLLAKRQFDFGHAFFDIADMTQKTLAMYRDVIAAHRKK